MKTIYNKVFIITLVLFSQVIFAQDHSQSVHQHIVREAWNLLKSSDPNFYQNFEMNNWIGNNNTNGPWDFTNQERVVAGAWREDEEDLVFDYWCWFTWTNTHFWKVQFPDNPDEFLPYDIEECDFACSPQYNAWNKIEKYLTGGWQINKVYPGSVCGNETNYDVTFQRWEGGTFRVYGCGHIGLKYYGLIEGPLNLYHTGYMEVVGHSGPNGEWVPHNPPVKIKLTGSQKFFAYEILGRIAHLIADQSIPAHVHLDAHPDIVGCPRGDTYETKMASQYQNYNATNCGGTYINPFIQNQYHPVFYLAFVQNQVSKNFPSNDSPREVWAASPPFEIIPQLLLGAPQNWLTTIFTEYGPNGLSQENFNILANYCMKTAIRITAGLLYWFAKRMQECYTTDLSLQNVTINPGQSGIYCANNNIVVSGENPSSYFIVEPNGYAKMDAGNSIILKPGFHAKTGSNFSASPILSSEKSASKLITTPLSNSRSTIDSDTKDKTSSELVPDQFSLSQNYPNPFNPSTFIQFALKDNVNVRITIYDILGRVVKVLVNEYQTAGYRSAIWDGTNTFGSNVSSGLYIYKIEAGDFTDSKKMLLVR